MGPWGQTLCLDYPVESLPKSNAMLVLPSAHSGNCSLRKSRDGPSMTQLVNSKVGIGGQVSDTNPVFFPPPRPATTGCHHVVGFERKREQCMVGVIRMGTKLSFPGHPLPAFRRGGQAREPSSQLQPIWKGSVFKSKEPEKIIHTKNKLCHESFDFASPPNT